MIPGFIISILTFPGVIVHELAHVLFCRLFKVPVIEVCYFRLGDPAGYVLHERTESPLHDLWIALGPFFVNSLIGMLISFPVAIPAVIFFDASILDIVILWLGISIAMHAFPSVGDAKSLWAAMKQPGVPLWLRIVTIPIIGLIYLGAFGSVIWLDLAYGVVLVLVIPNWLVFLLAG